MERGRRRGGKHNVETEKKRGIFRELKSIIAQIAKVHFSCVSIAHSKSPFNAPDSLVIGQGH